MITKRLTTPTSALPARPQRPVKYVFPVTAPDGSVGYDHPLENYFDASMASRLVPRQPTAKLYDTVARAHDCCFEVAPDMVDPSWAVPRPLTLNAPERRRSLANLSGNSPEYMGISPDQPGWRPRRSSYEDRRGAIGVTPSEVNTLVPYIPPIDVSDPPPSKERLDAMAKRFLADAHADFVQPCPNATMPDVIPSTEPPESDNDSSFEYDTDSTLDCVITFIRRELPPSESNSHDADFNSNTDTDAETDTDTDTDSDDGYDWNAIRSPPSGPGSQWLIPRKRPSVIIIDNRDVTMVDSSSDAASVVLSPPLDDEQHGKRRRRRGSRQTTRATKAPKRHADDAPVRRGRKRTAPSHATEESQASSSECVSSHPPIRRRSASSRPPVSIAAAAQKMNQVRLASPEVQVCSPRPAPHTATSAPPRSPKVFPCMLDGCTQVCASAGDLQRHQQSLRHRAPSHGCLACGKSYTRSDALKRHLNSKVGCKKAHGAMLQSLEAEGDEEGAEAMDAVRVAGRLG